MKGSAIHHQCIIYLSNGAFSHLPYNKEVWMRKLQRVCFQHNALTGTSGEETLSLLIVEARLWSALVRLVVMLKSSKPLLFPWERSIEPVTPQGHVSQYLVINWINLWLLTVYTIYSIIPTFFINDLHFFLNYYNIYIVKTQEDIMVLG